MCEPVSPTEIDVLMVDRLNGNNLQRQRAVGDAAIMHPSQKVMAIRASDRIAFFDVDGQTILKSFAIPNGKVVSYWRWIDEKTLIFVLGTWVLQWPLTPPQQAPVRAFQLQPPLVDANIEGYTVSADKKWAAVYGFVDEGSGRAGKVQLYSAERKKSLIVDAHAVSLAKVSGSVGLVMAVKAGAAIRVDLWDVGVAGSKRRMVKLPVAAEGEDCPLHLVVAERCSMAYVLTRLGYVHLVELRTGTRVGTVLSPGPMTRAVLGPSGTVVALSREGELWKFMLNESFVVDFVVSHRREPRAALNIAAAMGLKVSDSSLVQCFEQLITAGMFEDAARLAVAGPVNGPLRTRERVRALLQLPASPDGIPPLQHYFTALMAATKLNGVESLEICELVQRNRVALIEQWIGGDKLTFTEELGDLCKGVDRRIALAVYERCVPSPKVVASLAEMGAFDKLREYCEKKGYAPDWVEVAATMARSVPDKCEGLLKHIANQGRPLAEPQEVVKVLREGNFVAQAVWFLKAVLVEERAEDAELRALLNEIEGAEPK